MAALEGAAGQVGGASRETSQGSLGSQQQKGPSLHGGGELPIKAGIQEGKLWLREEAVKGPQNPVRAGDSVDPMSPAPGSDRSQVKGALLGPGHGSATRPPTFTASSRCLSLGTSRGDARPSAERGEEALDELWDSASSLEVGDGASGPGRWVVSSFSRSSR